MDRQAFTTLLKNNLLGVVVVILALALIGTSAAIDASKDGSDVATASSARDLKDGDRPKDKDRPRDKQLQKLKDRLEKGELRGDRMRMDQPFPPGLIQQFLSQVPKQLRQDLRDLRKADPEERTTLGHQMFEKALAGDYGAQVKKLAEMLEELVNGK